MLPEHGTFRRYLVTAGGNMVVFFLIWEACYRLFPEGDYWPTVSWAVAWILGSFVAHWTHRIWTFNSDRDPRWTVPASMAVYSVGLVGSTACYYIGTESMGLDVRIVWLANSSLWGLLNYLGQREIAFKQINTSPPS